MISSRWPRPIGIRASIALIPVCTGWSTPWRLITPLATFSTALVAVVLIAPFPSIALPKAFTTRPTIASPTSTSRILPVGFTSSPSTIFEKSPKIMIPTVSSSKLSATPISPRGNVTISDALRSESPETRAIPSNTSITCPTFWVFWSVWNFSICFLKFSTIVFLLILVIC
jgi:hypothetical protein